jgi:hypothetical protein
MACSFSILSISFGAPNATPSRYPLSYSVLDGPMIVMTLSGSMPLARRCV